MNFYVNKLIEMAVPSAVVIAAVAVGCLVAHFLFHKPLPLKRIFLYTALTVYLFVLLITAVFERGWNSFDTPRINLTPLYDLRRETVRQEWAVWMLVLNTLVFVPWGALLPALSRRFRKFGSIFLAGMGLSLAIEVTQYIGKIGIFETDDLIFNTLGTILGFLLYKICAILLNNKTSEI